MSAPGSLIRELEEAIRSGPPERGPGTLQPIAALFVDGASRFNDDHVAVFDQVLARRQAGTSKDGRQRTG
jgi:hypothetical protein